jgi:hypothetical protein
VILFGVTKKNSHAYLCRITRSLHSLGILIGRLKRIRFFAKNTTSIGIGRVSGATVTEIIFLLTKSFLKWGSMLSVLQDICNLHQDAINQGVMLIEIIEAQNLGCGIYVDLNYGFYLMH